MNFEISSEKADNIVIEFLSENGFGENISIKRYLMPDNTILTEVWDEVIYHNKMFKRITPIVNYNKLLKEILNYKGNTASYVTPKIRNSKVSFIIGANYQRTRGR